MALKIFCVNGNTRLISESRISIYTKYSTKSFKGTIKYFHSLFTSVV